MANGHRHGFPLMEIVVADFPHLSAEMRLSKGDITPSMIPGALYEA